MDIPKVYILLLSNNQYYIGASSDIEHRFIEHRQGLVKSTRYKKPIKIIFSQQFSSIKLAKQVEYRLKKLKSRKIVEEIIEDEKIDLEKLGIKSD